MRSVSLIRFALVGVALAALAGSCTIVQQPGPGYVANGTSSLEVNVNRPGGDYRNFDLGSTRPEECRDTCMVEPQCVAFTYVNPGVQGPSARCWLKGSVPPPNADACCVSGVKNAPPAGATADYSGAPPPVAAEPAPVVAATPPSQGGFVGEPPGGHHGLEVNVDRPGSDIANFDLPQPHPHLCKEACMRDGRCVAFTYVNPGVQGPHPRCWLKNAVPNPVPNPCCTSGVRHEGRGAPPGPPAGLELNVDRPGYDFQNFDLSQPRPELCREACLREGQCRAFTYVNPGFQGPNARCWLKMSVPQATPSNCCISGVK
jgi:1-phosphatidylinositol phosphodiesterase